MNMVIVLWFDVSIDQHITNSYLDIAVLNISEQMSIGLDGISGTPAYMLM